MKKIITCLIVCLNILFVHAQNKPAYIIYNKDGDEKEYGKLIKDLLKADVVFFGELHDNPIAHWLELEVTIDLFGKFGQNLVQGAEMFETDNQLVLSEYLTGLINQKRFEEEAKLWKNYKTDYKPIVEFAVKNKLNFVATNVPRRYASLVSSEGFEGLDKLSTEAKLLIPKLPIDYDPELPGYKAMLQMEGMPGKGNASNLNFPKAQAIKDATMAWSISKNLIKDGCFIHYNGSYHSNNFEGIIWYLKRTNPDIRILTIATVTQKDVSKLDKEHIGTNDFIIVIPEGMTRTY
jgi:uncharacterized iron-regulated protein